ncbi:hypothetical protein MRX96_044259 [Rhipicephalus microplus]
MCRIVSHRFHAEIGRGASLSRCRLVGEGPKQDESSTTLGRRKESSRRGRGLHQETAFEPEQPSVGHFFVWVREEQALSGSLLRLRHLLALASRKRQLDRCAQCGCAVGYAFAVALCELRRHVVRIEEKIHACFLRR